MSAQYWLRLYDDVLDDPKVQRLPPELFKHWINVLCLASKGTPRGSLPRIDDVAFRLRVTVDRAEALLADFILLGLIESVEGVLKPHDWHVWQYDGDLSTPRVQAHRERKRATVQSETVDETFQETACNVSETIFGVSGNVRDTDTDTETEQSGTPLSPPTGGNGADAPPKPKPKRASQMTDDWIATNALHEWAQDELGMRYADVLLETAKFRDHFLATGKPMKDWGAAWKNWMRRSREFAPARASPNGKTRALTYYGDPEEVRLAKQVTAEQRERLKGHT